MKKDINSLLIAVAITFFLGFTFIFSDQIRTTLTIIKDAGIQLAAVILSHNFKTVATIKSRYDDPTSKVRILIVPGHEPNYSGAEFNGLKERDMNVELGQNLKELLEDDSHYQVFITRDTRDWNPIFSEYYKNHWNEIAEWISASKDDFSRLVSIGLATKKYSTVTHNDAQPNVAVRLYGLTKWANENDIDIIIHIHFNDNRRRDTSKPGEYSGFSMYVPENQYGNSTTTKVIAGDIFKRLAKYNAVSDLPGETIGIIDEPELIAIGSNNTSDAASVLIEYGYIYEPQFQNSQVRAMSIKDLAYQTYLGLQDFFDPIGNAKIARTYDTLVLPYKWDEPLMANKALPADVFALQTALIFDGIYPPDGKTKNECPRTGKIGTCTRTSLEVFQNKYGITNESGMAGEKTLEALKRI